ncbi:methyltransferase domain-containing protein [Kitasatospora sp. NPDC007106]|uniref:class I SAM-dependent methyltransferase n=1 Tax=Kitasatospora sp. NPDC007106 TaxID=3156914 RepID=UPI0033FB0B17
MRTDEFAERYLSGLELWGDDFGPAQIEEWFADEREAYANLGAASSDSEAYGYSGFNRQYGFRYLPDRRFRRALGVGSAFGGEFLPVLDRIDDITILEPSAHLRSAALRSTPVRYEDPVPSGDMPFDDRSFDLVLCFGVLHHIPNVSKVVREIGRVTAPGGWVLLCEPVVSMGDWRSADRPGLTRRERGIPRHLLERAVGDAGLSIRSSLFCAATPTSRIGRLLRCNMYANRIGAVVDRALALATAWNYRYHPTSAWQKLRPSSVFIVAQRPR